MRVAGQFGSEWKYWGCMTMPEGIVVVPVAVVVVVVPPVEPPVELVLLGLSRGKPGDF